MAYGALAPYQAHCYIASGGNTEGEDAPVTDVFAREDVRNLLEAAQAAGSLGVEALALALDELDLEPAQVDEFHRALEELHVEVIAVVSANEPALDESTQETS